MPNEVLDDELTSINAIYGENTLQPVESAGTIPIYALRIPSPDPTTADTSAVAQVTLRVAFPPNYPDAAPTILGTESVGSGHGGVGAGIAFVERASSILKEIFQSGAPCLFDLIEELRSLSTDNTASAELNAPDEPEDVASAKSANHEIDELGEQPQWTLSDPITEKKSVFVARAAHATSPGQAKVYLEHLLRTDKKAARATHNISAWRIRGCDATTFQDCDDDGETAAGSRMLHLMSVMGVWDVVVVVTRWYGGVKLGPDRFRIINSAAREALQKGGFVDVKEVGKKKGR